MKYSEFDQLIEVVKGSGSDDNEAQKKKKPDESKHESPEYAPHNDRKYYESDKCRDSKNNNKPELHDAALLHPSLFFGNLPADFRKQGL